MNLFLRHALLANCEPTIFEQSDYFGGIWRYDPNPESFSEF